MTSEWHLRSCLGVKGPFPFHSTLTDAGLAVGSRAVTIVTHTAKRPWHVDAAAVPAVGSSATLVDIWWWCEKNSLTSSPLCLHDILFSSSSLWNDFWAWMGTEITHSLTQSHTTYLLTYLCVCLLVGWLTDWLPGPFKYLATYIPVSYTHLTLPTKVNV